MKTLITIALLGLTTSTFAMECREMSQPYKKLCNQNKRILRKLNRLGNGGPTDQCRCRSYAHSSSDTDYILEVSDGNGGWNELARFTTSDSGPADLQACMEKRRELCQ